MSKTIKKMLATLLGCGVALWSTAHDSIAVQHPTWTLQQCIERAKQESLTLKRGRISVQQAQENVLNARDSRLPSVSFSTSQGLSYRPFQASTLTLNGDQVVSVNHKTSYSGNYGINASMPLYDGGKTKNTIRQQELNTQIAQLAVDASEMTLEEDITRTYVQILYAQEAIKQDQEQITLAEQQLTRSQALFKAGLLNRADVSQLESQLATDRYQLVNDEMSRDDYKLQLKQMLELDGDYALELADPQLTDDVLAPLPAKADVYAAALALRPEIRSKQLSIDRSDIDIELAQASKRPTINAQASSSTNNSSGAGNMFSQLKDQWNNAIGVSVSVPIYDHRSTQHAVAKARLDKENARLEMAEAEKSLWKTIEAYWQQATSSQQRFIAAQEKVAAAQTSYELTSEQFRLGLKNIIELTTDKTQLITAQQQMLQAKYMAILNTALLRYYAGQGITIN
ncbi:MAG: TolC family protein [Muribaculaceae bacterium]|nr:TolC family protein [Muribaculaceae bacterium]